MPLSVVPLTQKIAACITAAAAAVAKLMLTTEGNQQQQKRCSPFHLSETITLAATVS